MFNTKVLKNLVWFGVVLKLTAASKSRKFMRPCVVSNKSSKDISCLSSNPFNTKNIQGIIIKKSTLIKIYFIHLNHSILEVFLVLVY